MFPIQDGIRYGLLFDFSSCMAGHSQSFHMDCSLAYCNYWTYPHLHYGVYCDYRHNAFGVHWNMVMLLDVPHYCMHCICMQWAILLH